jgi:hypothetical protein
MAMDTLNIMVIICQYIIVEVLYYLQVKIICMSEQWLLFMKLIDLEHNSRKHSCTVSTYHREVCVGSATVCMACLVCCSRTERASTQEYSHDPTRGPSRDGPREGTTRSCSCCWCIWVCIFTFFKLPNFL